MRIGSHPSGAVLACKGRVSCDPGARASGAQGAADFGPSDEGVEGHAVYAVQCQADFGKGPHVFYLPAAMLWSLSDLQRFRCPGHS